MQKITHFGTVKIGDIALDAAVLEDGRRGFIQKQLAQAIGFTEKTRSGRFDRFSEKIGLNELIPKGISEWPVSVLMPERGAALWTPYEILPAIIRATIRANSNNLLTAQQTHIAERCAVIADALIGVGIVALIDEATGYQYHREPSALQDLIELLIRENCADWTKRFDADFYRPLMKLFKLDFHPGKGLPSVIGQLTQRYIYQAVLPDEIWEYLKIKKGKKDRFHQWLNGSGLKLLERQKILVEAIAGSSADYQDFKSRFSVISGVPGQIGIVFPLTH